MEFTDVQDTAQQNNVQAAPEASQAASAQALNFDDELGSNNPTVIKIIGCGGGGSSAVKRMIEDGVKDVQFVVLNTDKQALHQSPAEIRVPIGQKITGGLGAGGNPAVGESAAKEDIERIKMILNGANMVIITAGMGGGTGTGSAPVVAELAHEAGILTIGVVTTPFDFEGTVRMRYAEEGLKKLKEHVDSLIVLPNDLIFKAVKIASDRKLTFKEQFKLADSILCAGARGLTELITRPGDINLDFADLRTVLSNSGDSIIGLGTGKGENRIIDAVEGAIANPLLENRQIDGAKRILINVTSNGNISLEDTREISNAIRQSADKDASIYLGLAVDEALEDDDVQVTVVATDFNTEMDFAPSSASNIIEETSEKDDTVFDLDGFKSVLSGGRGLSSGLPAVSEPVAVPESAPARTQTPSVDPVSSAAANSGYFASLKDIRSEAAAMPESAEPVAREIPGTMENSYQEPPVQTQTQSPYFTGREPPAGINLDDEDTPPYWKRKMNSLPRSIDLTQI